MEMASNMATMLKEMVFAAESPEALLADEVVRDLATQCGSLHGVIVQKVEEAVISGASGVETLLAVNDEVQEAIALFRHVQETGALPPRPAKPEAAAPAAPAPAPAPAGALVGPLGAPTSPPPSRSSNR